MSKDLGVKALEAGAINRADAAINGVANKLLYTVVMEDPTVKDGVRNYVTSKVDKAGAFAEIIGYEVTSAQITKLKTWNDVTELANKSKNMELISMTFPWHRVISIRNVSYKAKAQ